MELDDVLKELEELLAGGDDAAALELVEAALATSGPVADLLLVRGGIRQRWEGSEAALPDLEAALKLEPADPGIHFELAVALESLGRRRQAMRHLRRAAELDPEGSPLPEAIPRRVFEDGLVAALDALPAHIRERLEGLVIDVHDLAGPRLIADNEPYDPLLLGYFLGVPLLERTSDYMGGPEPDRVLVFQRAHELCFRVREDILDEARRTLYHEVAHFLGFEEHDMGRLGVE